MRLLLSLVLLSCVGLSCTSEERSVGGDQSIYVLVLTDTVGTDNAALARLRARPGTTVAVSGSASEPQGRLLNRLPWLLQPGVDTLFYDPDLAGPDLLDSFINRLALSSPNTIVRPWLGQNPSGD